MPTPVTSAHRLMYPAAALYAASAVPLWLARFGGLLPPGWSPAVRSAAVHAHEMTLGYALAVVGGFLMTRLSRPMLAVAVLSWLAGRLALLAGLPPMLALPLCLAYPVFLFAVAGLPFLRTSRSGHNAVFGPLIGALLLAEALFWAGELGLMTNNGQPVALLLIATLLLTMGGRVIPAATAGALRRQGITLSQRVQPRLEAIGIAGAALCLLSSATGLLPSLGAAGAAMAGAGALLRLARWKPHLLLRRPEIASLHLGYCCLGAGWLLTAGTALSDLSPAAGWHLLGVGALGILASAMMIRTTLQREAEPDRFPPAATVAVALIALAAALRLAAVCWPSMTLLTAAAVFWTLGQLLTAAVLLTRPRRSRRRQDALQEAQAELRPGGGDGVGNAAQQMLLHREAG
ncbi:NnrS family protein [Azospirillum sp. TSH100]|uniref:NnrS family protein n=1 Tax=Azospirillum sp. TSH100 TaxID=652764 RepID=UPI000D651078|nr:NnrS family protein [Azospirillum sp. TSH100]QCG90475.1 NnrS family protein [Azospirillum sp. TSH100]